MNKNYYTIIISLLLITTPTVHTEDFLKKRSGRHSETSLDVKKSIGEELKKNLTNSAMLSTSCNERIEILATKADKLLNNDALFSGPHGIKYEERLKKHTKALETMLSQLEQLNKELEKDFKLS